ncbi:MAG: hypothetical protein P4L49_18370 [Desulfosporosinus sp.]|nr:hypothetical protein [Desulfosporosinus sp.]
MTLGNETPTSINKPVHKPDRKWTRRQFLRAGFWGAAALLGGVSFSPVRKAFSTHRTAEEQIINGVKIPSNLLTFPKALEVARWVGDGLDFSTEVQSKTPYLNFNYATNSMNSTAGFSVGLNSISLYMATGDLRHLQKARDTADFLSTILPATGLVPVYNLTNHALDSRNVTFFVGDLSHSTVVQLVALLAKVDASYLPLMHKLADAIINYGINPANNLVWWNVDCHTGQKLYSTGTCYENQLGSSVTSAAEALLVAYWVDNRKTQYKTKALDILKAIWACRNKVTNLIPEVWDIDRNAVGSNIYPAGQFRYDDMGGAYVRGLLMAHTITGEPGIFNSLDTYVPALLEGIWDTSINSNQGGFRYLNNCIGSSSSNTVEIMYGLFIATMLTAEKVLGIGKYNIYDKCKQHADHVFNTSFGIKNYMVPHQLTPQGAYVGPNSDSQLGYATLQYPLGMAMLSQRSGDPSYRLGCNQVINTLLERHERGNNTTSPQGYVGIVETQYPYGYEFSYGDASSMAAAAYIPAYLLFNSLQPSSGVSINWLNDLPPLVFSLVAAPLWDTQKVRFARNVLTVSVSGAGTVNVADMGLGDIVAAKMDGASYLQFRSAVLTTQAGTHNYDLSFDPLLQAKR